MGRRLRDEDESEGRHRRDILLDVLLIAAVCGVSGILWFSQGQEDESDPPTTTAQPVDVTVTSIPLVLSGERVGVCEWSVSWSADEIEAGDLICEEVAP